MAHRARLALVALVAAGGCVFDNPIFDEASSASGGASSTGASTSVGATATAGASATSTTAPTSTTSSSASSSTGTSGTVGASESSGDPSATTSITGDPTTSTTGGGVCPAVTAISSVFTDDPACASCLESSCCGEFTACAGACQGAIECALNEKCLTKWTLCAGFDEGEMLIRAANQCMNTTCFEVCNLGPCAVEQAACRAKPACKAILGCVYTCNQGCMPGDGPCQLACVTMCKQQNPMGAAEYDAIWDCVATQCN
ncbi:MAG: hypothetical protein H6710_24500 [Myxococcales bacterium]|nr:hypothetical protein [Myxococcales bacterium]MCB9702374.1 hypothetical protein [Myxococcales bacterium]